MLNSIQNQQRTGGAQINCTLTNVTVIPGMGYPKLAVKRVLRRAFGLREIRQLNAVSADPARVQF
jgi:hypothetical protein